MSEAKWTPGPWEHLPALGANSIEANWTTRPGKPQRRAFVEVHFFDKQHSSPEEREQLEANAQLIAAAPDLAEALRVLMTYGECGQGWQTCKCGQCEGYRLGKAALAKAGA